MRSQSKNIVEFRLSKQKEVEEIIWTFSHLSELQVRSSQFILPRFSKSLIERLRALKPARASLVSPITVNKSTKALLASEFSKIYRPRTYQRILARVENRWRPIEKDFFKAIRSLSEVAVKRSYRCYLTFYGGGGSFGRDREIYIRVNPAIPSDFKYANYTIAHELIHLMTESYLKRKKISSARWEHFVDQIILKSSIRGLL